MNSALLASVAAVCFILICWGYWLYRAEPRMLGNLGVPSTPARRRPPSAYAAFELLGRRFAPYMLTLMGPHRIQRLRTRLNRAGNTKKITVERYAARRVGLLLIAGSFAVIYTSDGMLLLAVLLVAVGWFWTDITLNSAIRRRQREIEKSLPDFLDVLTVCVSAGLGFRQALERVAFHQTGPLGQEISTLLHQMELGTSRRAAFEQLRERYPSGQLGMFITALLQAEELGAPLNDALLAIAGDLRNEAAQSARRRAARAVPRVSAIVTLVLLPATVLLLGGALFIGSGINLSQFTGGR